MKAILQREPAVLLELIKFSAKMKLDVVRGDLSDTKGKRVVLNFGHTVGHSIEQITEYKKFLHGEAVSIGMVVALRLGEQLGVTEAGLGSRTSSLLSNLGLPVEVPSEMRSKEDMSRWLKALKADKKREAASVNFVLVEGCGRATTREIGLQEIVNALQ